MRKALEELKRRQKYVRIARLKVCHTQNIQPQIEHANQHNLHDNNNTIEVISQILNQDLHNVHSEVPLETILNTNKSGISATKATNEVVEDEEVMDVDNVTSLKDFEDRLRKYCLDFNLNQLQTTGLLQLIRSHDCLKNLPKDSGTLLKTDRNMIKFSQLDPGIYLHYKSTFHFIMNLIFLQYWN